MARALVSLGLAAAAAPAFADDCQLACKEAGDNCMPLCGGTSCPLKDPDDKPVTGLRSGEFRSVRDCHLLKAGKPLVLRYRSKGRWTGPIAGVPEGTLLSTVFDKQPADPCGVPSKRCLQQRMNGMVAAVGGHGIDNKDSKPGGQGDPCLMGWPCGQVVPPPAAWQFRLPDASHAGTWTVRLARGTPAAGQAAEQTLRIERGVVSGDGAWFAPGGHYAYRHADAAGRVVASGEFSLVSRSTLDTLRTLAQRRVAEGLSEGLAWSDTLAANQLEWDALQLMLAAGGDAR